MPAIFSRYTTMNITISYLISSTDKNKKITDPDYFKILLDDEKVPSFTFSIFNKDEISILKELHEQYLHCDFLFYPKNLSGFRIINDTNCEICYFTNIQFFKNVTKKGKWYTLSDIQEQNILLEEYYGELFYRRSTTI